MRRLILKKGHKRSGKGDKFTGMDHYGQIHPPTAQEYFRVLGMIPDELMGVGVYIATCIGVDQETAKAIEEYRWDITSTNSDTTKTTSSLTDTSSAPEA